MLNATVVKKISITPELLIIGLKPDGPIPNFQPGQYVALGLLGSAARPADYPPLQESASPDKIIKRAYSIGSSPLQKDCVEFYIAVLPEGELSSRLVMLNEGDRMYMAPKITGTFTVTEMPKGSNLILVCTGTGLAPYISMLRTPATWDLANNITVIHGVRYVRDLGYRTELLELQSKRSNFKYYPIVSRADDSWQGERGYVQKYFETGVIPLDHVTDHVFLCGNPAMIEHMEGFLGPKGYTEHTKRHPGNLHLEKYW
jgi:ferredoxin--NADP+ reductase